MNSLRRNNRRAWKGKALSVLGVLVLASGLFYLSRSALVSNFVPVWRARNGVADASRGFLGIFRPKTALIAENNALKQKLADDEELIASLRILAGSRDELLSVFGRSTASGTPATVVNRPPSTPYDMLTIDAGSEEGIRVGQTAVLPSGVPVGTVSAVLNGTADVTLYSSSGVVTSAVLERNDVPIELHGRGGGDFSFDVPRDTPVEPGDRILSASLGAELVAVVGEVDAAPTDAEASVLSESPVSLSNIRYLFIR